MQTLLLGPDDVDANTPLAAVIDAVEGAFGAYARGDVVMPAKSYVDLPRYNGDFRSMPAYVATDEWDAAAVKWVNVHADNPETYDLPHGAGDHHLLRPRQRLPALADGRHPRHAQSGPAPRPRWRRTTRRRRRRPFHGPGRRRRPVLHPAWRPSRRSATSRRSSSPTSAPRPSRNSSTTSRTGSTSAAGPSRRPPTVTSSRR